MPYVRDDNLDRPAGNFALPVGPENTYNSIRADGRDEGRDAAIQAMFNSPLFLASQFPDVRPRQDSYGIPDVSRARTITPPPAPRAPDLIPPSTPIPIPAMAKRPAPRPPLVPQFVPQPPGSGPPRPICAEHGSMHQGVPETCAHCNDILVWWWRHGRR